MKITIATILLFAVAFCYGQRQKVYSNPYLSIKADSVVLYDYNTYDQGNGIFKDHLEGDTTTHTKFVNSEYGHTPPIIVNDTLSYTILKSVKLRHDTALEFAEMLSDPSSFGAMEADCFMPHLGIVYWQNGRPIAYISICMDCNVLSPNMKLGAMNPRAPRKKADGTTEIIYHGMRRPLRKFLRGLLAKYNFSHQPRPDSVFDN